MVLEKILFLIRSWNGDEIISLGKGPCKRELARVTPFFLVVSDLGELSSVQ
jgi:hypothetical protein